MKRAGDSTLVGVCRAPRVARGLGNAVGRSFGETRRTARSYLHPTQADTKAAGCQGHISKSTPKRHGQGSPGPGDDVEWIKLLTKMRDDPDIVGLSDAAFRDWINGLLYAGEHETDGRIPQSVLRPSATEVVNAGLFAARDGNYVVVAWKKHQKTRAQLKRDRALAKDRKERWSERRENAVPNASGSNSTSSSKVVESSQLQTSGAAAFDRFWPIYPRHDGGRSKPRDKFISKVKAGADPEAIIAGATRYRDDPNREDAYTAHATTWLNQERWDDPPLPPRSGSKARGVSNILRLAERAEQ